MFGGFILEITQKSLGGKLGSNGYLKDIEPLFISSGKQYFNLTKEKEKAYTFYDYEIVLKFIAENVNYNENVLDWCLFYKDEMRKIFSMSKYKEN